LPYGKAVTTTSHAGYAAFFGETGNSKAIGLPLRRTLVRSGLRWAFIDGWTLLFNGHALNPALKQYHLQQQFFKKYLTG
jgi:hypothetical protein